MGIFNFTVKEDEPLEKEVAIDPEMLGKVFENLLDIKDRKSTGRYYTPREIVHYMCQQSLINYLETNTSIPRDDIEKFIQLGDFALDLTIRAQEQKKRYHGKTFDIDESLAIPKPIEDNYKEIDRLLKEIKIVDPAVGSGAFPIGMMNEIVKARSILSIFFDEDEQRKRTVYNFKRETIENSLYGVDIDSSAVDIAKLRFWLSLIVDEEDIKNIKPLPNLDHKIMCGNSLLEEFEGVKLFDEKLLIEIPKDYSYQLEQIGREVNKLNQELHDIHTGKEADNGRTKQIQRELKNLKREKEQILSGSDEDVPQVTLDEALQKRIKESQKKLKELEALQKKFFNEQNRKLKRQYVEEIDRIEWELIEETLKEEGNEEAMQKLEQYKKNKSKPFFLWKLYFSEIFQRENPGFDVVIANPPYVSVKQISSEEKKKFSKIFFSGQGRFNLFTLFLEKGHKLLRDQGILTYILPEGIYSNVEYRYIREYTLQNSTLLFVNLFSNRIFEAAVDTSVISLMNKKHEKELFYVFRDLDKKIVALNQDTFNKLPFHLFTVNLTPTSKPIIDKLLSDKFDRIGEILEIQQGIIYSGQPKEKVFSNEQREERYKKVLDGRDVLKWRINWKEKRENKYIFYTNKLHRPREERLFLSEEKILLPRKSTKIFCAYDDAKFYALNTAYICLAKDNSYKLKYILSCLNSKLVNYYYLSLFFGWQITIPALNSVPIKRISPYNQELFINLVDRILNITKDDDYLDNPDKQAKVKKLEEQIDKLVYELYELTPEEIEIIEAFNKGK